MQLVGHAVVTVDEGTLEGFEVDKRRLPTLSTRAQGNLRQIVVGPHLGIKLVQPKVFERVPDVEGNLFPGSERWFKINKKRCRSSLRCAPARGLLSWLLWLRGAPLQD
jgi:hypothetical protein